MNMVKWRVGPWGERSRNNFILPVNYIRNPKRVFRVGIEDSKKTTVRVPAAGTSDCKNIRTNLVSMKNIFFEVYVPARLVYDVKTYLKLSRYILIKLDIYILQRSTTIFKTGWRIWARTLSVLYINNNDNK